MYDQNRWDKIAFASGKESREEEYWSNQLAGESEKCSFPGDYERIPAKGTKRPKKRSVDTFKYRIPGGLSEKLMKLSTGSLPKMHMILIAGITVLINKYTGIEDIIVGTSIYKQEIKAEFINTVLALRIRLHRHMTFRELLYSVRKTIIEADENQNYPIEMILQKLKLPYAANDDFPLFDIAVLFENIQDKNYLKQITTNMRFTFLKTGETGENLEGAVEYNPSRYRKETPERIVVHLQNLLYEVLTNVDKRLSCVSILSAGEKSRFVDFCNTRADYPGNKTIHQLVEDQVVRTPDRIAVAGNGEGEGKGEGSGESGVTTVHSHLVEKKVFQLSCRALHIKTNQTSHFLRRKGVRSDTIVALKAARSTGLLIAILGILKAGGAYMPIDKEIPGKRLIALLKDSTASILINDEDDRSGEDFEKRGLSIELVILNQVIESIQEESGENLPHINTPGDLAYVIFTSGSTGNPKGVMIDHRGLVNYIRAAAKYFVKNERLNFSLYTSISFDLTVTSIFTPLITGNTIVVYRNEDNKPLLEEIIDERNVGIIKATPSHLRLIRHKKIMSDFIGIKRFIVGGEALDSTLIRDIYRNFKEKIEVYNEYGPTEATVGCMLYKYNIETDIQQFVPVGKPVDNYGIYLLDRDANPVPVGAVGEIFISGAGLARGYMNRPELTHEKFYRVPGRQINCGQIMTGSETASSGSAHTRIKCLKTGDRLYRTGDLARWLPDGGIEFLGRIDAQVKIRGFRIELGEIESQLLKYEGIKEAVVILRQWVKEKNQGSENGDKYLCAYITAGNKLSVPELKESLSGSLPDYMVPEYFVQLEQIPLTLNGKVNMKLLPEPHHTFYLEAQYETPRTGIEKKLVNIWAEVLAIEEHKFGINHDFYMFGGDSIKAMKLISRCSRENMNIRLIDIFKYKTIKDLVENVDVDLITNNSKTPPQEIGKKSFLTPIQKWFFQNNHPHPAFFNLSLLFEVSDHLDAGVLEKVLQKMIELHDGLRINFIKEDGTWKQYCQDIKDIEFSLEHITLEEKEGKNKKGPDRKIMKEINRIQGSLNFGKGLLLKAAVLNIGKTKRQIFFTIHHLIFDIVSNHIFFYNLAYIYKILAESIKKGKPVEDIDIKLPAPGSSSLQWSDKLYSHFTPANTDIGYWKRIATEPVDYLIKAKKPLNLCRDINILNVILDKKNTSRLKELVTGRYEVTVEEILISTLITALHHVMGITGIIINLESHGREPLFSDIDLSRSMGWFTNQVPLLFQYKGSMELTLLHTKKTLRELPHRGIHYNIARYILETEDVPEFDSQICFNYHGDSSQADSNIVEDDKYNIETLGRALSKEIRKSHPDNYFPCLLIISPHIAKSKLFLRISYNKNYLSPNLIKHFANDYISVLKKMAEIEG